jgi:Na+/H+-dicarboxylate symporter/ABC-type amino acid transport substrate-binding protein
MKLPRLSLSLWILISVILGISTGLFFGELCSVLEPLTGAFIKIWQITVLPSVAVSLIVGVGSLKRDTAKAFVFKAVLVILLIWIIAVAGYLSFQFAFPPRVDATFFSTHMLTEKTGIDLTSQFIPANPFNALSDGIIPATVIFCLLLGFALMLDDGSGPVMNVLKVLMAALGRMMQYIAWTFPFGIFVITTVFIGTLTFEGFLDLQVYLITLAAAGIMIGFVAMPLLISCFTPFRYREILSAASEPLILAFTTGNEFITLPMIGDKVKILFEGKAGDPDNKNGSDNGQAGSPQDPSRDEISSQTGILVPIAYTVPMLGELAPLLFILFVAWCYQAPLDLLQQVQLVIIGIPTLFGSSSLAVVPLLNLLHLPTDAYNLYVSSGAVTYSIMAPLTVMSIFTFTTITVALTTNRARFRWKRAVTSATVVVILAVLLIAGLNAGFAHMLAGTYHDNEQITRIQMPLDSSGNRLDTVVNTTVYLKREDVPPINATSYGRADEIRQIRERGVLRVGYNEYNVPFAFFNEKGELVGYDIEMAYDLARALNISRIEFVPLTKPSEMPGALESGYCDLVMSAVMVNQDRLEQLKYTDPVATVHLAFVVPDGKKEKFVKLEDVRKMEGLRVAVFNNTALVDIAKQRLPRATIVPVNTEEEFFDQGKADVLMIPAEEGYPMTLKYPFFDVAIVEPHDVYKMMYAYPVAKNSSESYLLALNYWIRMEKDYGMLDRKYDYWVQGNIPSTAEPRWSVVKNVLHWGS